MLYEDCHVVLCVNVKDMCLSVVCYIKTVPTVTTQSVRDIQAGNTCGESAVQYHHHHAGDHHHPHHHSQHDQHRLLQSYS